MNNHITVAAHIPVHDAAQTISISPVILDTPKRGLPLEMRITAPVSGHDLPIILLSHGGGPSLYISSKDGYGPLVNFYAEHGFVVVQPTHASSRVGGLSAEAPGGPFHWRSRVSDMKRILDGLDEVEALVPAVAGRLDHSRIAAVGHSLGGKTVGMLLGARLSDPNDASATNVNMMEPRIKAGVLMAAPGNGGDSLAPSIREAYSILNPDFSHLTTPTLVIAGDSDVSPHLTTRGADWHVDPYTHAPGSNALLTLIGGKHGMGGIAGYDAKETDDEDPDRLAITQRMSWAYIRSALFPGDTAWADACKALEHHAASQARVDTK